MNDGVAPLPQLRRDLAAASRQVTPVLEALKRAGGTVSPKQVAAACQITEEDARSALNLLEASGLAETVHFRITPEGRNGIS